MCNGLDMNHTEVMNRILHSFFALLLHLFFSCVFLHVTQPSDSHILQPSKRADQLHSLLSIAFIIVDPATTPQYSDFTNHNGKPQYGPIITACYCSFFTSTPYYLSLLCFSLCACLFLVQVILVCTFS